MQSYLDQNTNLSEISIIIPVLACILTTYKLYSILNPWIARVPHFNLGEGDDDEGDIPLNNPEDTYDLLVEMGLIDLLNHPTVIGLFTGYLAFLANFSIFLNLNLESLDPGTLMTLLNNLKPFMTYNELFWSLLRSVWYMLEVYDFNIDYVPEEFEEQFRTANNNIFAVYRAIEGRLNIDTGVPLQWFED